MALIGKNSGYKWEFESIGGTSRVKITSGSDIAHLGELDPKMWTVLSCPVQGLEISDKSLAYMDTDADGKIRVNDVVAVSKWITGVLKNSDLLLEGKDSIDMEQFDLENEAGKKLHGSAKQIIGNLGKEGSVISLADTADIAAIFAKTRFNGDGVIIEGSADEEQDKAAIAAAVAAREAGRAVKDVVVGGGEIVEQLSRSSAADFGLRGELPYIDAVIAAVSDEKNIVEKERKIDAIRWAEAEAMTSFDFFTINFILSYLVKVNIVARWTLLSPEVGREMLNRLIKELDAKELVNKQ